MIIALFFFWLVGFGLVIGAHLNAALAETPAAGVKEAPDKRLEGATMAGLMEGKRGLIMGLANDRSLAWGIAKALHAQGAEMAFSYQGEALAKRVRPLAAEVGSDFLIDCDVSDMAELDAAFATLAERWPTIDFLVHAIGFSDKNELRGLYVDTSLDNFLLTMNISVYSASSR